MTTDNRIGLVLLRKFDEKVNRVADELRRNGKLGWNASCNTPSIINRIHCI